MLFRSLEFVKPPAMKVFNAVKNLAPMNVAHIHGNKIYTADVLDFPVPVLSWEDRLPGNPTLEEIKKKFPGAVMGGIDHTGTTFRTRASVKENAREGIRRGGKSRFILANGCSVPSWMDPAAISGIVEAAKEAVEAAT